MRPTIQQGVALVLHGAQGTGKTKLARELAGAVGRNVEIDSSVLADHSLGWLEREVRTYIVNELPPRDMDPEKLKALIAGASIRIERGNRPAEMVSAPNFIFCTNDSAAAQQLRGQRRFQVIEVTA